MAWLDCDVIFENSDWASHTMDVLGHFFLLQLFERWEDLSCDFKDNVPLHEISGADLELSRESAAYQITQGGPVKDDFQRASGQSRFTTGLGWACKRELLTEHPLYDACIIGGGDRMIFAAAMGWFDLAVNWHKMTGRRKAHFLIWARKFYDSTQGRIGTIPGRLFHLWHGNLANRNYVSRFNILAKHNFDPFRDIELDSQGIWKWASEKPEMHQDMVEYFASRKEDSNQ